MKIQNSKPTIDNFSEFALSNIEMSFVRGGEDDPIIKPTTPPVII